jgi:hypothetical protein
MSPFRLSYFAIALALCAPSLACGGTAAVEESDGGTRLSFSDPTLLADKYVTLREDFDDIFCEYFDPDGRVFGSGLKTTEAGSFQLNGYGRWDVFEDRACLNYEGSSRCTHVVIHEDSIDWFSDSEDEYLYTTNFGIGPGTAGVQPCGTRPFPPSLLKIVGIRITSWPERKPNGSQWDASVFTAPKRPDLRISMVDLDAAPGTANATYHSHTFTNAHSQSHLYNPASDQANALSNDNLNPMLPVYIPHDHSFRIILLDDDFGGVNDDEVGRLVRVPADIAEGLDDYSGLQTFTFPDDDGHGVTFQVIGRWSL